MRRAGSYHFTVAILLIYLAIMLGLIAALFKYGVPAARAEGAGAQWWQTPSVRACCSDADAVYADEWAANPDGSVTARVTGGGPRNHAWAPIGREYLVPPDKVLREPGNPTGRPLLFIRPQDFHLYCFATGPET